LPLIERSPAMFSPIKSVFANIMDSLTLRSGTRSISLFEEPEDDDKQEQGREGEGECVGECVSDCDVDCDEPREDTLDTWDHDTIFVSEKEFSSLEKAEGYVEHFAAVEGFEIVRKNVEYFREIDTVKTIRARLIKCKTPECPWKLWIRAKKMGHFRFTSLVLDHNHGLVVLKESVVKRLEPRHKKRIQLLATGGLGCSQIIKQLEVEFLKQFNKWSVYYFLSKRMEYRHWDDARNFVDQLMKLKELDSDFFSAFETDEDMRLNRVFFHSLVRRQTFVGMDTVWGLMQLTKRINSVCHW
jgi:hypothetical protein